MPNQIIGKDAVSILNVDPLPGAMRVSFYGSNGIEIFGRPSFFGAAAAWVIPATPTDLIELVNPTANTKFFRVGKIIVTSKQNTAGINLMLLIKRIALNTGGSKTPIAVAANDSRDGSPTGLINVYTANATALGSGTIAKERYLFTPQATSVNNDHIEWSFDDINLAPAILYPGEQISVNFNGAALPAGLVFAVSITWTEEPLP